MNKIKKNSKVVYTSITGGYDTLKKPLFMAPDWDYICFTNDKIDTTQSAWQIRPIPIENECNTRLSRYVKLVPHNVLQEYDYSVWIDASIQIKSHFITQRADELIRDDRILSLPLHSSRNCIYDEANVCISINKDNADIIGRQVAFLRDEGFPENYGLYGNCIIFRQHNNPNLQKIGEEWWNLLLRYSKRDQLSLSYLLWKNNLSVELLTEETYPFKNSNDFELFNHGNTSGSLKNKIRGLLKYMIKDF